MATFTTPQIKGLNTALIDDIEDRGTNNKRLREQYLEIEKQVQTAALKGDDEAVEKLKAELSRIGDTFMRYNMGLCGVLVKKYITNSNGDDDIESYMLACMEAMWLAFTAWDPSKSSFGTWSRKALEGALWREVAFTMRPQRKYYEELAYRAANNHAEALNVLLGRAPTDEEIAQATGITVAQLRQLRRPRAISLDAPRNDEQTLLDTLGTEDAEQDWEADDTGGLHILNAFAAHASEDDLWLQALAKATANLDDLSLYLVFARTGLHGWTPENLPEIAAATGIGREIVRRKTHKALETIKSNGRNLPNMLQ